MRRGIQETDKSFVFYREIGRNPVTVSLRTGWIWIDEQFSAPGVFNWNKKRTERMTFTTEDARNLIAAIQELLPIEETEKHKP